MIKSMTGYGRSEIQINGKKLVTEIRAVNHRFLEVVMKLPSGWLAFEDPIRKLVKQCLHRGRVDLYISLEGDSDQGRQLSFDWDCFSIICRLPKSLNKIMVFPVTSTR